MSRPRCCERVSSTGKARILCCVQPAQKLKYTAQHSTAQHSTARECHHLERRLWALLRWTMTLTLLSL